MEPMKFSDEEIRNQAIKDQGSKAIEEMANQIASFYKELCERGVEPAMAGQFTSIWMSYLFSRLKDGPS